MLWITPQYFVFIEYIIVASVFPAVLNLLPIYPLDGGKIIALSSKGKNLAKWISNVSAILLLGIGVFLQFNPPLILFAVTILLTVNLEKKGSTYAPTFETLMKRVTVSLPRTDGKSRQECSTTTPHPTECMQATETHQAQTKHRQKFQSCQSQTKDTRRTG